MPGSWVWQFGLSNAGPQLHVRQQEKNFHWLYLGKGWDSGAPQLSQPNFLQNLGKWITNKRVALGVTNVDMGWAYLYTRPQLGCSYLWS